MSRKEHRVGMISYGLSAKVFHIPFVNSTPGFKLQAICQRHPIEGNDASKDHPDVTVYNDPGALIKADDIDVVIVGTPPGEHLSQAKQALEAGKHVVVEKPFCPSSADCDELIRTAKKHNKLLTVYQNRRWDNDYQTLQTLLKNDTLGRIVEFESHFDRWSPNVATTWKGTQVPGTGTVYDLGAHLIDQIVHSFGMPKRITGVVHSQREHNPGSLEDSCTVLLHYDGMLATVKTSVLSAENNQLRFLVRGSKGSFRKYHLDIQEPQLLGGMPVDNPDYAREPEDRHGVLTKVIDGKLIEERYPNIEPATYGGFYRHFAKAIDANDPTQVPVNAADSRNVIYLIELARKSAQEGRTIDVSQ